MVEELYQTRHQVFTFSKKNFKTDKITPGKLGQGVHFDKDRDKQDSCPSVHHV